jgi:hypothetical protein
VIDSRDVVVDAEITSDPEPLVGRTGGAAVDSAGQVCEPQARSVRQHPPPRLAGQVRKPGLQVNGPWPEDEGLIGVTTAALDDGKTVVVSTTVVVSVFPDVAITSVVVVV